MKEVKTEEWFPGSGCTNRGHRHRVIAVAGCPLGVGASVVKEAMDSAWGMLNLRFLEGPHSFENSLRVGSKGKAYLAHLSPQHRPCHVEDKHTNK